MALDPVTAGIDLVTALINKLFPDKSEAEKAQIAATFQLVQGQLDANKAEAAQPGMHFRDGAGWVCVAGFAFAIAKAPIEWLAALVGHPITLPNVDTSVTTTMLFALLGLGAYHTAEQIKGAA